MQNMERSFDIDWGIFGLVEFIVSDGEKIGNIYKTALDIGSGQGKQTEVLRAAGLEVFQLDKYSDTAEYKVDLIEHDFGKQFDVIFCSHVIEHQRNVGNFLDKIHDIMSDDAILIISAPKHPAETMIEGHLNCFFTPYFTQHLIHAGFDLKIGKYLSCGGIENTAIVSKAKNFDVSERNEVGYQWADKHKDRSFFELKNSEINKDAFFYNSSVFTSEDGKNVNINIPKDRKSIGIQIAATRWGFKVDI